MFYATYVRNELLRRRGRTIVTLLGLGLGVALVITIVSLSNGLDRAQRETLDPLGGIGTDITVTLTPQQNQARLRRPGRRQPRPRAGKPIRDHRPLTTREAGRALRARLLPAGVAADVPAVGRQPDHLDRRRRPGRGRVDAARPASGGRRADDRREAEDGRPDLRDPAQLAAADSGAVPEDAGLHRQAAGQERNHRPWRERRRARRRRKRSAATAARAGAFQKCLPASLQRSRTQFTTPEQTLKQVLDPPQTNITTTAYTIGGVDQTKPDMGVVTIRR